MSKQGITANKALKLLKLGNAEFVENDAAKGNMSAAQRKQTSDHGQEPYAIVVACSDSRVIPEAIFNADLGELFVIRVAGNVIDDHQLGSIEYAAEHLGVNLVLVLGHTHCGAVAAAIEGDTDGYIKYIVDEIQGAIGQENDPYEACHLNVRHSMKMVEESLKIQKVEHEYGLKVRGAIYDIETGKVDFLEDDMSVA